MSIAPADLFLSATLTVDEACRYLASLGFDDPGTADARLQGLAEDLAVREALGRLASMLVETIAAAADPDAALAAFVRHVESQSAKVTFLESLRSDPRALGLLVDAAGRSAFVADALQRSPGLLHWLVKEVDRPPPDAADLSADADAAAPSSADPEVREAALVRFHRRELLRIAVRDVLGRESLEGASSQLTALADVTLSHVLRLAECRVREEAGGSPLPGRLALVALGRLGASEPDYAPDVELVIVYEPDAEDDVTAHRVLRGVASGVVDLLAHAAAGGDLYRLDLPVHTAALTGAPAASLRRWQSYCAGLNDHRLRLALVRARLIAGDSDLGRRALETFTEYAYRGGTADGPLVDLRRRFSSGETTFDDDVRNGAGGIADLEVFTATLRLAVGRDMPAVRTPGTLEAIGALAAARVLTDAEGARLASSLIVLRRVEQRLSLARGEVPPTLDDPSALDLAAAALDVPTNDALRERLYVERLTLRAICRAVLART